MLKEIVLITGGGGLVGNALKSIEENYTNAYKFVYLTSNDGDLRNLENCEKIFHEYKPEYVIHLAANVGGLFKNMNNNIEMFEDNILINLNVVKTCYKYKVKKLISCLSTCVFPDEASYPMNEEILHDGPPHFSNEGYSYAKRMLEVQTRLYNRNHDCQYINVVPTNIYGPHDNFSFINSHVIPGLIHKCYVAKKIGLTFDVKGSGKPLRQFLYSVDFTKIIMKILQDYTGKDTIIIAPDKKDEISIGKVAKMIAKKFEHRQLIFNKNFNDGQYKKTVSNQKLKSFYPEFQFTRLEDGIGKTIEWFVENYEKCRK